MQDQDKEEHMKGMWRGMRRIVISKRRICPYTDRCGASIKSVRHGYYCAAHGFFRGFRVGFKKFAVRIAIGK